MGINARCNSSTNHTLLHLQIFTSLLSHSLSLYIHRFHLLLFIPNLYPLLPRFSESQKHKMEKHTMISKTQLPSFFAWTLLAMLLSPNLLFPVMSISFEDQKNYYGSPDPHTGTPPTDIFLALSLYTCHS